MASRLQRDQDRLNDGEHRQPFMTALDAWPRLRGADCLRETQISGQASCSARDGGRRTSADVLSVSLHSLRRREVLRLGAMWRGEVLGETADDVPGQELRELRVEGASRLPRVVEGRNDRSIFGLLETELGDDIAIGDPCVNLPGGFYRPAELSYYRRLLELRRRTRAA